MSSVVCIVFVPLLLWSWKKEQSYKIDRQGREVLNFQITMMLVMFTFALVLMILPAAFLMAAGLDRGPGFAGDLFTMLQPLPVIFLAIFTMYQGVVNAVRALSDKPIHYSLSIQFVK